MMNRILLFVSLINFVVSDSVYDIVLNHIPIGCPRSDNLDVSKVKVYYYNFETNSNATYPLKYAVGNITARSDFDKTQCIHIFCFGFANTIDSHPSASARCTFSKITCNDKKIVGIIIDHSEYTNGNLLEKINYLGLYERAVKYSKSIAIAIGGFFVDIQKYVVRDNIQVSGHSLGGQMIGYAARVSKANGYPLPMIFAMDAAGPGFTDCLQEHINKDDADIVTAIHCNAGELGTDVNITSYDAYSGDGMTQDGCGGPRISASPCSHSKCVPNGFQTALQSGIWQAQKCTSYSEFKDNSCSGNDNTIISIDETPTGSNGVYFYDPSGTTLQCDV